MRLIILWQHCVLEEMAIGLSDVLSIFGVSHECIRTKDVPISDHENLYIIVGVHHYNHLDLKNYIIIQTEQPGSSWFNKSMYTQMKNATSVWDFSPRLNQKWLEMGVNSHYVPIRIPMGPFIMSGHEDIHFSGVKKDIDVLFYGCRNNRRFQLEKKLKKAFPKKVIMFRYYDLFGAERERIIARSKIVINTHFWIQSSLETHRIEYLLARGKCVVSERSMDEELDTEYSSAVVFCGYDQMVSTIGNLLKNPNLIGNIENSSRQLSEKHQFDISHVKKALSDSIMKIEKNSVMEPKDADEIEPYTDLVTYLKDLCRSYLEPDHVIFEVVV